MKEKIDAARLHTEGLSLESRVILAVELLRKIGRDTGTLDVLEAVISCLEGKE